VAVDAGDLALVGAGLAAGAGLVYVLTRPPAPSPELAFAITGPTEATAREMIRAGVEAQRIEAGRQVDLAGIFASSIVELERVASAERIAEKTLQATKEIEFQRFATSKQVAEIVADVEKYRAEAELRAVQAQVSAQQQKSFFDFLGGIIGAIFGGLF
jgi:NAD(P)-dependent dehydrogenase (short-subunit alcohol dehydrogenase family)